MSSSFKHTKCRSTEKPYGKSDIYRFKVPDDKVDWKEKFEAYKSVEYTDPSTQGKEWADKDVDKGDFKWNAKDGDVDRTSFICKYEIVDGRPRNPMGRTGLSGRGILGKWGPNHAADPIVSRMEEGKLQFVAVQRSDTGEWALPGGMVDAGEEVSATLKREFTEETLDGVDNEQLKSLWNKGNKLYEGYVDDPRNTDNSWMETVVGVCQDAYSPTRALLQVVDFHDDGKLLQGVDFKAGSDASNVKFVTVEPGLDLYASHNHFIKKLAERHGIKF